MNEHVNANMDEFWNGTGGEKWLLFQEAMDESLRPFGHQALAFAAIRAGENVLDIGCGCGDTSIEIARRVGADGSVQGVDISAPILARAKSQAEILTVPNLSFEHGDAQVCPLRPEYFDLVFSRFGIMFFDDPVAAFTNLRRAMKLGGRLVFICWQPIIDNEWVTISLDVVARHITLPPPPGPQDSGPMSFGKPERVNSVLSAAGFTDIAVSDFSSMFTIGNSIDQAVDFLTQMGPASGAIAKSDTSDRTKSEIAADLRNALSKFSHVEGVTLGAATWIVTASNGQVRAQ